MKAALMTTLLGGLLLGACSVVGVRDTEEPPHTVLAEVAGLQIRRYEPRLAAETTVPGDQIAARSTGFQRLAGYIFGANTGQPRLAMTAPVAQAVAQPAAPAGNHIAMTAPVAQTAAGDGWVIRFFLPAGLTLATAPTPRNPDVHLVTLPAETMAVLRFSGQTGAATVARQQARLTRAVATTGWRPAGPAVAWFYDPPWTIPALRRNEVAIPVTPPA